MTDETPQPMKYAPDAMRERRLIPSANAPAVSVDKPIRFRVAATRPATQTKHYPRKARSTRKKYDRRNVRFF